MKSTATPMAWTLCILLAVSGCGPAVTEANAENGNESDSAAGSGAAGGGTALVTDIDRASYLIGYNQVAQMTQQTMGAVNVEAFAAGIADAVAKRDAKVPLEQLEAAFQSLQTEIQSRQQTAMAAKASESAAFRDQFAQQDGVQKTASGLLYEVLTEGDGAKPGPTDTVVTHYHGTLTSGEVFDSSVQRGTPATFRVDGVIRGWTEALQMMNVGSKWRLVVPPELAYGERGAGQMIGPNTTLVFEVELLEIQGAE